MEQQAVSAWPYIEHSSASTILSDTRAEFNYVVTSKGVGPAIIDEVNYVFDGQKITGWGLDQSLQKKYPELKITGLGNAVLDNRVLAPRGCRSVVRIEMEERIPDSIRGISSALHNLISLDQILNKHGLPFRILLLFYLWKVLESDR